MCGVDGVPNAVTKHLRARHYTMLFQLSDSSPRSLVVGIIIRAELQPREVTQQEPGLEPREPR